GSAVEGGPAGPEPAHELQRPDQEGDQAGDDVDDQEGIGEGIGGDWRRRGVAAGDVAKRGDDRDLDSEQHDEGAPAGGIDWDELADHVRLRTKVARPACPAART